MRERLIRVSIGLALMIGFVACNDPDVAVTPHGENSTASGRIAFRLSDTVLQVVKKSSDSLRIEAFRDGYAMRTATGHIAGSTLLPDLAPGEWLLKAATFDALQAVSWYGETLVQIRSGGTTEAVLVLRRATGSVNIRIELDSVPTAIDTTADTLTVKYTQGNLSDYQALPVEGAWRTDAGIFIATRFDYCVPVVVSTPTETMFPQELTLVGKPLNALVAVERLPHVVFVPFPSTHGVSIANLLDDSVIRLPGKPAVVTDSSFVQYMKTVTSNWIGYTDVIILRSNGEVVRDLRQRMVDTNAITGKAIVSADTMAMIRKILEQSSVRHPAQVPTITDDCVLDKPVVKRQISYAGGIASTMTWNPSSYCGELPDSWKALDPIDAILDALFAKP